MYKVLSALTTEKSKNSRNAGISLYPDLIEEIDKRRGLIQSTYIQYLLKQSLRLPENKEKE